MNLRLETTALRRIRSTQELSALAPHQRRRTLRGAFRVSDESCVRDREVVLVDDIMTTGATARECARVLMRAGARRGVVATVARAQPENSVAMWSAAAADQAGAWAVLANKEVTGGEQRKHQP